MIGRHALIIMPSNAAALPVRRTRGCLGARVAPRMHLEEHLAELDINR
jgi:hypothetical protein